MDGGSVRLLILLLLLLVFLYRFSQARQWITYCDLELSHSLFDRVEAIFKRCLLSSTSIDLWKFYLDFVRRRNPVDYSQPEQGKAARQTITQSFEFALNRIGQDRRAGEVWIEYLGFLKEGGVSSLLCLLPLSVSFDNRG